MLTEIVLYLLAAVSAVILLVHFLLSIGVLLNRFRDLLAGHDFSDHKLPKVSVIVAAKDEEKTLPGLLECLKAQSFSDFEVVLVNDRSADGTDQVMEGFKEQYGERARVIHNQKEPGKANPKQLALDIGVQEAGGEILIFTDADCVVPSGWVEKTLQYFKDPRVGVVFGQISLKVSGSFLEKYQAFDQSLIHQYSSGSAAMGIPTGCFGNNLSARKRVIDDLGGFQALGYTLTEDAALISAAAKLGWKVRVSTLLETMIETVPKSSWRGFINQHVRWNTGAFFSEDLSTRLGYRFIVLYLIVSILVIPFALFMPILWILTVTSFISIGLLSLLSGLLYRKDKVGFLLRVIPYTLFFMLFYGFIIVLCMLKISPEWKGRKLKSTDTKKV